MIVYSYVNTIRMVLGSRYRYVRGYMLFVASVTCIYVTILMPVKILAI